MDLINFGVNILTGVLVGTGDIASVVVSSALQAMGLSNTVVAPIANTVSQTTTVAASTAAVAGTAYGATKLGIKALFLLSTKPYILEHVEAVGYRIAKKGKKYVIEKNLTGQNKVFAMQPMKQFIDEAMIAFKDGVDRGLNE